MSRPATSHTSVALALAATRDERPPYLSQETADALSLAERLLRRDLARACAEAGGVRAGAAALGVSTRTLGSLGLDADGIARNA